MNQNFSNNNFSDFNLNQKILKALKELNFNNPTPIQKKVIPQFKSSKRDIIASAETGTGKTAAFGLPLIDLIRKEDSFIQALILCPTRELCIQIAKDLNTFSKYQNLINILPVYGGEPIERQIRALKNNNQIIVGTPGRTKDLIRRKKLKISKVSRVILDEADEMLSMGFKEDLEFILDKINVNRQTLLFSATMTKKVKEVTKRYMNEPVEMSVAKSNTIVKNVKHLLYFVEKKDKYEAVKRIVDINQNIYGIIFCRTRNDTKLVAHKLVNDKYSADTLHGDLSQSQRDDVMFKFRNKQVKILVATDVAARGIDINNLTHIINYNLPDDDEIYVHRSGRTGRAGKKGVSIVIATYRDKRKLKDIEKKSNISFINGKLPNGPEICKSKLFTLIERIQNVKVNERQIQPFLQEILKELELLDREQLIKHFISTEFNRYLTYYEGAKDINSSTKPIDKKRGLNRKKFQRKKNFRKFSGKKYSKKKFKK